MPGPGRPREGRIVIATPKGKPGRPKLKLCSHPGCGFPVVRGNRWCGKHTHVIEAALKASTDYRRDDLIGSPRGGSGTRANEL